MHPIIKQIRKRRGQVVPFEQDKITLAITKAFEEVTGEKRMQDAEAVMDVVVTDLVAHADAAGEVYVPSVEEVQDLVERALMQRDFFDVAKAYIVYRYEHQKIREEKQEEVQEKIQKRELLITKEDGTTELFLVEKIRATFMDAARGFEGVIAIDELVEQAGREIYDGMTTRDVANALVLVARSFIEQDPAYSMLASRLLQRGVLYKDAIGSVSVFEDDFTRKYQNAFVENVKKGVELKLLDERMLGFDLEKVAAAISPERDDLIKYMGIETLTDRYLVRDTSNPKGRKFLETPQMFWMRVAMGLALGEDDKNGRAVSFYHLMSQLLYTPSTPTLFNAGTPYSQLSSCYLGVVSDDLHSIFKSYEDYSHMAKHSGGMGYSWTKLRATGSVVKTTGVTSNGVVPFLKILDSTVVCINRSGRRRGACAVYLEPWHLDVEGFIELRKNTGDERRRTPDLNTALWIPDLFMKRVREGADWTLFSPDDTPDLPETYGAEFERRYTAYERMADEGTLRLFKRVKARDLWKRILTQLYETGHPWITFKDTSNIRSPQDHVGVIHNSNLCTEVTLNNAPDEEVAVCNLGYVNLGRHITNGVLDEEKMKETIMLAMRMLDNVIDINFYPIPETRASNMRHRPVGLGFMGFQDAVFQLGYAFDSEETVRFADESGEMLSYYAILASSELAKERGAYQTYKGSKWDRNIFPVDTLDMLADDRGESVLVNRGSRMDWAPVREHVKKHGMRNSNCMVMAPTATTANITGAFPTIEPIYKNIYVKANISGTFIVMNDYLVEDLKREGLWNHELLEIIKGHEGDLTNISAIPQWIKDKHKEVFKIDQKWLIKAAAARGKWIDQAQSLNIFYSGTSGADLSDIYMYAWQTGLKTTYYLRTLSASGNEMSTVSIDKQQNLEKRTQAPSLDVAQASAAVADIKQELVAQEAGMRQPAMHKASALKLCKIDDPTCEACQ